MIKNGQGAILAHFAYRGISKEYLGSVEYNDEQKRELHQLSQVSTNTSIK